MNEGEVSEKQLVRISYKFKLKGIEKSKEKESSKLQTRTQFPVWDKF